MTLDRTFRLAQQYIDRAQQELIKTRSLASDYERDMRGLRSMLQRKRLMGEPSASVEFGLSLCKFLEGNEELHSSRQALAAHLTTALSFVVEALGYMVGGNPAYDTPHNRIQVRSQIRKIASVLGNPAAKSIPMDGLAAVVARGETLARMSETTNYSVTRDLLKSIRQLVG